MFCSPHMPEAGAQRMGGFDGRRVGCPRCTLTRRSTSIWCTSIPVHRRGKSGKRKAGAATASTVVKAASDTESILWPGRRNHLRFLKWQRVELEATSHKAGGEKMLNKIHCQSPLHLRMHVTWCMRPSRESKLKAHSPILVLPSPSHAFSAQVPVEVIDAIMAYF